MGLTPIKKLDIVLRFLSTRIEAKPKITHSELWNEIKFENPRWAEDGDFPTQIYKILDQLIEDKYVVNGDQVERRNYSSEETMLVDTYVTTFKGDFFNEQGGYGVENLRLSAENIRAEKLETSQQKLMGKLNDLTFLVALTCACKFVTLIISVSNKGIIFLRPIIFYK